MATTVQEKTAPISVGRTRSTSKKKGSPQQGSPRTFKLPIDSSIQSEPNSPLSPSSPLQSPNLSRLPRAFTPERARKSYKRSSILRKLSQRTMPEEIVNHRRRLNQGREKESEGGEEGNPKDAEGGAAPLEASEVDLRKSQPKKSKSRNKSSDADGEDTMSKRKRFQKNHSERNIFEKREIIFEKGTPPSKRSPKGEGMEEKVERTSKEKKEKKDDVERGASFKLRKSRKNEVFWKKGSEEETAGDEFSKKRSKKSQNFDETWKKIKNMTNNNEEKKEEKLVEKEEEDWDTEEMDFFTFLRLEEEDVKKVPTPELPPLREKDQSIRKKKKEKAKKEEEVQYSLDFEADKIPQFELAEECKQALQTLWKDFITKKTNTAFGEESAMTTFYQIFSQLFLNTDAGKRLFKGSIAKLGPSLVKYLITIMGALDNPQPPLGSFPKETSEPRSQREPKEPTKGVPVPEQCLVTSGELLTTRRRKETIPKVINSETFREIAIQHRIYGAVYDDYLDFGQAFCDSMEKMEIDFFYQEESEGKSVWMYVFEVFGNFIMDFGKKIEEKKTSGHVHIAWRRDGNWKKCFMVLSLDTLYIYKEEKSKLLLSIKLSNVLNIDKLNKFDHNSVPSDFGFELNLSYHRKPTIWICTSEPFAKSWMKELKWRMVALDGLEA